MSKLYCVKIAPEYQLVSYYPTDPRSPVVTMDEWSDNADGFLAAVAGKSKQHRTETHAIAGRTIVEHWIEI